MTLLLLLLLVVVVVVVAGGGGGGGGASAGAGAATDGQRKPTSLHPKASTAPGMQSSDLSTALSRPPTEKHCWRVLGDKGSK